MPTREMFYEHLRTQFLKGSKWAGDEPLLSETDFGESPSKSNDPKKREKSDRFYILKSKFEESDNKYFDQIMKKGHIYDQYRCVGSSARFVYSALKEFPGVCFEQTLVAGIVRPHLDAHFSAKGFQYYVEGKCAEIYNKPSDIFRSSYLDSITFNEFLSDFYEVVKTDRKRLFRGKNHADFIDILKKEICKDSFVLKPSDLGIQDLARFDFKQFICHVIGIAYGLSKSDKKRLLYLYYDNWDGGSEAIDEFIEDFKAVRAGFKDFLKSKNITLCLISHNEFGPIDCEKFMGKIESSINEFYR